MEGPNRRSNVEIDPAAEDRLVPIIENYKKHISNVIDANEHADGHTKQIVKNLLDLISPEVVLRDIRRNSMNIYGGKTLAQQFNTWLELSFVQREFHDLEDNNRTERPHNQQNMGWASLRDDLMIDIIARERGEIE